MDRFATQTVEAVIINFRDNLEVPRFPEPAVNEPRDSATNKRVQARNAEIIESLQERRDETTPGLKRG